MRRRPALSLLIFLLALVAGFAAVPAARAQLLPDAQALANRQFVQAMQEIQKADQTYDPAEQARLLQEADRLLADIVARMPETTLAVQLSTNQFIGDFDVVEFKNRVRALACNDPQSTSCLLQRTEGLLQPIEYPVVAPRWDWLSLAVAHHHFGDKARVRPIVSPFLAAFRRQAPQAGAKEDFFLGRALALTGEFDLALQLTRQIGDCSTRLYNVSDVVKALIWKGEGTRAASLAEEAVEYARTQNCAWELGLVAQILLRVNRADQARTVFHTTVEEQFTRYKERKVNCCPPELAVAAGDLGDANLALSLLRTVQDGSPWTLPAVLGRLMARGEGQLAVAYADQIKDQDTRAETYVALMAGALRANDRASAEIAYGKLGRMLSTPEQRQQPLLLVQRARADRLLYRDQRWRSYYQQAVSAAERQAEVKKDMAVPFLAALVEIETGLPLLE
jgi:tetratricopeptide (TPR) repeat protein